MLGITDREGRLCFAVALWNERDPILKERFFGLSNPQGNHGEDPKEVWHYLDSTPTHSYMRALYKYPQSEFPYQRLIDENARRSKMEREFELQDTGIFNESRYFDVTAEYAKAGPDDILIRLTLANRGPETARLHVLPTLWFRNGWMWGCTHEGCTPKPRMSLLDDHLLTAQHETLRTFRFAVDTVAPWLFTENETNNQRIFGTPNLSPYVKDAFHEAVVHGRQEAVNPKEYGTKAATHYALEIPPGGEVALRFRLASATGMPAKPFDDFEQIFSARRAECAAFYETKFAPALTAEAKNVARQAYAGLLWTKQFYHYVVKDWLTGDPNSAQTSRRALARAQSRLGASLQRGRHLDAGQMGVPLVCGVGPGVSYDPDGADRRGLRQAAAPPLFAGMVHAPERRDPRLRMEFWRRQSAGARLGVLARL